MTGKGLLAVFLITFFEWLCECGIHAFHKWLFWNSTAQPKECVFWPNKDFTMINQKVIMQPLSRSPLKPVQDSLGCCVYISVHP